MTASYTLVEARDDGGRELVRRADPPPPGSGAWLFVSPAQWAVVCGAIGGPLLLDAGRHELAWGDETEAWFVSRRVFADVRWGTREPVLFHDAEFRGVFLRAHGRCALSVLQPLAFVERVVLGAGCFTTEDVEDRVRETIAAGIGAVMAGLDLPLADVVRKDPRLAAALQARVAAELAPLGLGLPDLRVTAITPPEDVARVLDERAEEGPAAASPRGAGTAGNEAAAAALGAAAAARPAAAGCRACGDTLPLGARYCPGCGHARGGDPCRECGAAQPCDARYCPNCGVTVVS